MQFLGALLSISSRDDWERSMVFHDTLSMQNILIIDVENAKTLCDSSPPHRRFEEPRTTPESVPILGPPQWFCATLKVKTAVRLTFYVERRVVNPQNTAFLLPAQ